MTNSSSRPVVIAVFGLLVVVLVIYVRMRLETPRNIGLSSRLTAPTHYTSGINILYDILSCRASYCHENYPIPRGRDLIGYYGASLQYQYNFPIHRSREVQLLFDQGMMQQYGFNLIEAARNFEAAIEEDPLCAMCYWGLAYSKVANINSDSNEADAKAGSRAIQQAIQIIQKYPHDYDKLEERLIYAMSEVFPKEGEPWSRELQITLNQKYIDANRALYQDYPRNVEVKTLYAEALINTSPWKYFEDDRTTLLPTIAIANQALEEALEISEYKHPLALHYYIHMTEQSMFPAKGKLAADSLSSISGMEGTGHLSHMPSHTYFRIGNYDECIRSSYRALDIDTYYATKCLTTYFPLHNVALLVSCALSSGQLQVALDHSFDLAHIDNLLADVGHQLFPYPKELLLAQFGRWEDIRSMMSISVDKENLADRELYQNSLAARPVFIQVIAQYARLLTLINLRSNYSNDLKILSDLVARIPKDKLPEDHHLFPFHRELGYLFNATAYASAAVASENAILASSILQDAVTLQKSFKYMEPEYFYRPLRQCLAAAELEASRNISLPREMRTTYLDRAYETYLLDLADHPRNGWSVYGLMQALKERKSLLGDSSVISDRRNFRTELIWNNTISWRELSIADLEELYHHVWRFGDMKISGSCCELGLC